MAATASATPIGTYKSIAANVAATHATGSAEVITVVHRLGATPNFCTSFLRSVVSYGGISTSGVAVVPQMAFRSANASQAIFDGIGNTLTPGSNWQGNFDFYFEVTHSLVS